MHSADNEQKKKKKKKTKKHEEREKEEEGTKFEARIHTLYTLRIDANTKALRVLNKVFIVHLVTNLCIISLDYIYSALLNQLQCNALFHFYCSFGIQNITHPTIISPIACCHWSRHFASNTGILTFSLARHIRHFYSITSTHLLMPNR